MPTMFNCSELYMYTSWHTKAFNILAISIPILSVLNTIASCFTMLFIGLIKQLRVKYIFSFKLFLFNSAECLYALYQTFSTSRKYSSMHSKSHIQILSVFQLGQMISIGFITYGLIQKASGSMACNNRIVIHPSQRHNHIKLLIASGMSVLINIILSVLISKLLPLYGTFVAIDVVLYIILFTKVSKMQKLVGRTVSNLRKKALTYISMLFVGFIAEIGLVMFLGASHKKHLLSNCQPMLSITDVFLYHILELRFLWDVLAYFAFNAYPRKLLTRACTGLHRKIVCRRPYIYSSAAVLPYNG